MSALPPFSFLSVCSGIEAASVAWDPLGWECAGVSEIDFFPAHVLSHRLGASRPMFMPDPEAVPVDHKRRALEVRRRRAAIKAVARIPEHGRIPNFGDLEQYRRWNVPAVDLLVGGTPCQSFSVAGLRKGMDDPRGNLALVFLGLVDRVRPTWVAWENVPGVLSSNGGRDFGAFVGALGELGYGWAYRVVDAQYVRTSRFRGAVPQRRRRVFLVGYLGDWRPPVAVLFDRDCLRGDPPPRREPGQRPAPTLAARTRGGGTLGTDFEIDGGLIPEVSNAIAARDHKMPRAEDNVGIIAVAPTLRAGGNQTGGHRPPGMDADTAELLIPIPQEVTGALSANGGTGAKHGFGMGQQDWESGFAVPVAHSLTAGMAASPHRMPQEQGALIPIAFDSKGSEAGAQADGTSPTLRAMGHAASHPNAGGQIAVAYAFDAQAAANTGHAVGEEVAGALHGGGKHGGRAAIALPWAVRRLTPVECERLQGFPDGWTDLPYGGRNSTPDGPRYKALGNSMAINCMDWLGQRIEAVRRILAGGADP